MGKTAEKIIGTQWLYVAFVSKWRVRKPNCKLAKFYRTAVLKVVSATFLLVCFFRESTCETTKNIFYFISKAFFAPEIIKFQLFRYSNVIMSLNAQAWIMKFILLNNLESEHSLVMKLGQCMASLLLRKNFHRKIIWKMWTEN